MKKRLNDKLNLNKNTVADLNQEEKKKIKGGTSVIIETCLCYTEHKSCSWLNCCPPPDDNINQEKDQG